MAAVVTGSNATETQFNITYNGSAGYVAWVNLRTGQMRIFDNDAASTLLMECKVALTSTDGADGTTLLTLTQAALHVALGVAPV